MAMAMGAATDSDSLNENLLPAKVIDPNLAAIVAADYLPAFYPGDWEYFNHLVCYDLDGLPAAYIMIFRDPNSSIKTWEELTAQVKKASDELDELDRQIAIIKASQETHPEDKDRLIKERKAQKISKLRRSYLSGDFATVVTGATDQSQLLIRCYRGLPSVLVNRPKKKKQLLKKHPDLNLEFGKILYLGPSDIRYKLKSKKIREHVTDKAVGVLPEEESYIFSEKEKKLISISAKKEKLEDMKAQKKIQLDKLSSKNRKLLEESKVKGKLNNIEKWSEYEQIYLEELKKQQGGEGDEDED